MYNWKNQKIKGSNEKWCCLLCSLVLAAFVTGIVTWQTGVLAQARVQQHLAQEVLRFHILANSDSAEDQSLKLKIRDQVLDYLKDRMPDGMDVEQTTDWMRRHTGELEVLGRQTAEEAGYDYPVSAAVTTCYFPEKTYGDVTFPAGNYEALRIEIGAAKGHNWWCVLYPSLCFLDVTNAVVPEEGKQELKSVLTEEEYTQITAASDFKIKWYFVERMKEK